MSKPFFSIIIPTLNEAKYLPHLLTDLTNQTYQNFEVIVVDGHSEDKTVTKAKEYSSTLSSLKVINSDKRHVCFQRNLGAQHAQADWLIFMDADNRLPSYFLQGIKYRLESESCDLASTYIKPEKDTPQQIVISRAVNLYYETETRFSSSPASLESMIIIKNAIFQQIGGFDPNINLGEGRYLTNAVKNVGGEIAIFKDPQYTYSLRRLSHYGSLRTIAGVARSEISALFGIKPSQHGLTQKLYPMLGGSVYNSKYKINKRKIPSFLKNIQKLLQNF